MDDEVRGYCEEIIECMIRYAGLSEKKARRLLRRSGICKVENEWDRKWLFHEFSYYWAMMLTQGDAEWYLDPTLWPPPDEYYEWLRERWKNKIHLETNEE